MYNQIISEIKSNLKRGETDKALKKLDNFISSTPIPYKNNQHNQYNNFPNPLEELIYKTFIKPKKEVHVLPCDQPYFDLYLIYSALLLEVGRVEESEKYLKEAYKLNPVSSEILLRIAQINEIKQDMEYYEKYSIDTVKYGYIAEHIARGYRKHCLLLLLYKHTTFSSTKPMQFKI